MSDFDKSQYVFEFLETQHAGHAVDLARNASVTADAIIAVGGDGTLNEVINGIVLSNVNTYPKLGLFPAGTANDFAKTVGITSNINELFDLLKNLTTQTLDIGKVDYVNHSNQKETRYFLNIADIGLGGYVVQKVNESSKWLGPKLTFLKTITTSMVTYKKTEVNCVDSTGNIIHSGKTMSLIAANGRYFGSGLCIAPGAQPSDGLLDVVVLGDISMLDYIRNVGKVKKGIRIEHEKVTYSKHKSIHVEHKTQPIPLDIDGEFAGYTPLTFSIAPTKVQFLCNSIFD